MYNYYVYRNKKILDVMRVNVKNRSWDTLPMFAKSVLEPIAQACPYEAGPAVDRSRAILYYYTGKRYHNACEGYTSPIKTQKRLKSVVEAEGGIDHIVVYPNPTKDQLTIDIQLEKEQTATFKVFNLNGQLLLKETLMKNKSKISMKGLAAGVYLYRIINEKGDILKTDKLIIQ